MDLISSVMSICGTVSQTDRQYRLQFKKLSYELKKAQHLASTDKVNNVPKFMLQNLHHKIDEAKEHLAKIQQILTQDRIPFKQKIKLSLPFNKTLIIVKTSIQDLQKAQQDVIEYGGSTETENNGKRFVDENQQFQKKQQTMVSLIPNDQANDQDIEEVFMGPTVQEDAAIQFTRNKYILVTMQLCGAQKIINFIKELDENFLVIKNKILVKFEKSQDKFQDIEVFSLGRLNFRSIYTKLREVYPEIDRISKQNHFMIKLRRSLVSSKELKIRQIKQEATKGGQEVDEFFSFPVQDQRITMVQIDTFILQRTQEKTVYLPDSQGKWVKMLQTQRQLASGECIAPFIPPNRNPQIPDIYYKVQFQFIQ